MKKILKLSIFIFVISIIFANITLASENKGVNIQVIMNPMEIMIEGGKADIDNFIYNGLTYVPLRKIIKLLKWELIWDGENNINLIDKDNKVNNFYDKHDDLNTTFIMKVSEEFLELEFQLKNKGEEESILTLSHPYYNIIIYDEDESEIYNYFKEHDYTTLIEKTRIPKEGHLTVNNKIELKKINMNPDEIYKVVFSITFESRKDKYILSEKSYFKAPEVN